MASRDVETAESIAELKSDLSNLSEQLDDTEERLTCRIKNIESTVNDINSYKSMVDDHRKAIAGVIVVLFSAFVGLFFWLVKKTIH